MRYRGDGSYKPDDYELEESFLDLLNYEHNCVDRFNTCIRAYDKAKKTGMKTFEHIKDINEASAEVIKSREELRKYIINKLSIGTEVTTCQK